MAYFITGGTGFIGRNFIDKLKEREGDIYVLTRAGSRAKFEDLQERMGESSDSGANGEAGRERRWTHGTGAKDRKAL